MAGEKRGGEGGGGVMWAASKQESVFGGKQMGFKESFEEAKARIGGRGSKVV